MSLDAAGLLMALPTTSESPSSPPAEVAVITAGVAGACKTLTGVCFSSDL